MKRFDVVVFGATGYCGKIVCEHIVKDYMDQNQFTWAMAGRSKEKLEQVRAELAKINPKVETVELMEVNTDDQTSVDAMAAAASVVITTVGPYAKFGPPVIQACVDNFTHYCDLTGEPQYIRRMSDQYHEVALAKKVKIVHSCGLDSVPSEVVTLLAAHHMQTAHGKELGEVNAVFSAVGGGMGGGTVDSLAGVVKEVGEDREMAKTVAHPYGLIPHFKDYTPSSLKELPDKGGSSWPAWSPAAKRWSGPFILAPHNEKIVRMSNALLGWKLGKQMKYSERWGSGVLEAVGSMLLVNTFGVILGLAARFPWFRKNLPAAGEGPERELLEKSSFAMELWALSHEPDTSVTPTRVFASMKDPNRDGGYLATCRMILECALCMIPSSKKLLEADPYASECPGGILPPSAALGLVLHDRLRKSGFELASGDADSGPVPATPVAS